MENDLVGQSPERVSFDYAVTLAVSGGNEVRIECVMSVHTGRGDVVRVEPRSCAEGGIWLIGLLRREVTEGVVGAGGDLRIEFVGGVVLECVADPDYEAWTLTGPKGETVVAVPGGGVERWRGPGGA